MGSITRNKLKRRPHRGAAKRLMFTDLALRNLKPPASGQANYWDRVQKGLALLVSSGGTKTFRSQYKLHGKWVTRTIGRLAENTTDKGENFSVHAAREQCRNDRAKANKGENPCTATVSLSVQQAIERFIEERCKPKQRTWDHTRGVLMRGCHDWLSRPLASIQRADARELLKALQDEGKHATAIVTLSWLKTMWRWLAEEEIIEHALMDPIKLHIAKPRRDRTYSADEVKAIWRAAGKLDPEECAYMRLMVLLTPRKTALALMRWSDLNNDLTVWTTPADLVKQKKQTAKPRVYKTPLPPAARAILNELPRTDDRVFPSLQIRYSEADRPLFMSDDMIRALRRHGAPRDFKMHCMRHTIATWLEDRGHDEYDRGLVLNHAGAGVTAGYSHGIVLAGC